MRPSKFYAGAPFLTALYVTLTAACGWCGQLTSSPTAQTQTQENPFAPNAQVIQQQNNLLAMNTPAPQPVAANEMRSKVERTITENTNTETLVKTVEKVDLVTYDKDGKETSRMNMGTVTKSKTYHVEGVAGKPGYQKILMEELTQVDYPAVGGGAAHSDVLRTTYDKQGKLAAKSRLQGDGAGGYTEMQVDYDSKTGKPKKIYIAYGGLMGSATNYSPGDMGFDAAAAEADSFIGRFTTDNNSILGG